MSYQTVPYQTVPYQNHKKWLTPSTLLVLLLILLLGGCGGGSSGPSSSSNSNSGNSNSGNSNPATNAAPVANAGPDQTVSKATQVTLDGSNSNDSDGDTLTYNWTISTLPDNSNAFLSDNRQATPVFFADVTGTYVFSLAVNDGTVDSSPDTVSVTISNIAPIADAGDDNIVDKGFAVTLSASNSFDADNDPLTYQWSLLSTPEGSTVEPPDNTQNSLTFTPDLIGIFQFSLTVNDGTIDSEPVTVNIEATNTAPVANAGADMNQDTGSIITLNASNSSDFNNDPLTYFWTLQSQPSGSGIVLIDSDTVSPSFTANIAGTYQFGLVVNDGTIDSNSDSVIITTTRAPINTAPVAVAGEDRAILAKLLVQLDGSNSSDIDGDVLSYRWTFNAKPQNSAATLSDNSIVNPTFIADLRGTYLLSLVVNDGQIDSEIDSISLASINSAPVANAGPDQTVKTATVVTLDGTNSSDLNGDTLNYRWNINSVPSGSNAELSAQNIAHPTFTADIAGTYAIDLRVDDRNIISEPDQVLIVVSTSVANSHQAKNIDSQATISHQSITNADFITVQTADSSASNSINSSVHAMIAPQTLTGSDSLKTLAANHKAVDKQLRLPTKPKMAAHSCQALPGVIGVKLNGAAIMHWLNGQSFDNQGFWHNVTTPVAMLNNDDDGQAHSSIYGYIADGFPLYGPYYAAGVLAKSSWQIRNYDNVDNTSGCGGTGLRNCQLIDQYDMTKGTTVSADAPATDERIILSTGQSTTSTSGDYFEDYYHNPTLSASGGAYLDKHNGHQHDQYGYHYHLTMVDDNGTLKPIFPYTVGPELYGEQQCRE